MRLVFGARALIAHHTQSHHPNRRKQRGRPSQPPPERSRRTRRALQRHPPRASAPTEPTGPPIHTTIRKTSARSGSIQPQRIRAAGGSLATLKTSLAPASSPDTLPYVQEDS